jgi:hypothetical protein
MTGTDVHTGHCCVLHGCKYGDDDCPVETGAKEQSYSCEQCEFFGEEYQRIFPSWTPELEDALRKAYHSAPPIPADGGSRHGGLRAVYEALRTEGLRQVSWAPEN